jgi:hypothetical protein
MVISNKHYLDIVISTEAKRSGEISKRRPGTFHNDSKQQGLVCAQDG